MADGTLTKTATVLDRFGTSDLVARFAQLDEGAASRMWLELNRDTFRELGEPDTITVTIQPGDRLN